MTAGVTTAVVVHWTAWAMILLESTAAGQEMILKTSAASRVLGVLAVKILAPAMCGSGSEKL